MRKKQTFLYFIVMFCLALGLTYFTEQDTVLITNHPDKAASEPMAVHYIDVGQADSTYIKLPDGKHLLIDSGEYDDGPVVADYLEKQGVQRLDYVVATHPHEDHIGGMSYILEYFGADILYMPDAYSNTKVFERLLDTIENNNIKTIQAKNGVEISSSDTLKIDILSPVSPEYDDLNDYSAVVRITYGDTRFVFMGDAEKTVEKELLSSATDLGADVIKIGHHGSSTSSSKSFIKAVNPSVAIISVGADNSYGHPGKDTLALLKDMNITTLRTDINGTVVVGSDGKGITY